MEGHCTCGAIRYRLTDKPLFTHCCHCRWCQRETGSTFVLNALIETDRIEVIFGEPISVQTPSASGRGQDIRRCGTCFTALWSHYSGMGPRFAFVRVGTLDNPDRVPPDIHIYTESKQPWVVLPFGARVKAEYYDRKEEWPADSLARFAAARAQG